MQVFDAYAAYYDLLYRDKRYDDESRFVLAVLQRHMPHASRVLEFGAGTGGHAAHLAESGLTVVGIDQSASMLEAARQRAAASAAPDRLRFVESDITEVHLDEHFDAVVSLFHVFSYLTTNERLLAGMAAARRHLDAGGLLLFDFWYGPGVLTDLPSVRVKRFAGHAITATRVAEPVMVPDENVVEVNYEVLVRDHLQSPLPVIRETHRMRYLFGPELRLMLASAGFQCLELREWATDNEPRLSTWCAYVVARAV